MKRSSVGSDSSDIHYPAGVQRYFQINKGYVFHGLHFCFVAKIHFFFYPQATTPKKSFLEYLSHIVILIIISCRKREILPLLRTKRSRENSKTLGSWLRNLTFSYSLLQRNAYICLTLKFKLWEFTTSLSPSLSVFVFPFRHKTMRTNSSNRHKVALRTKTIRKPAIFISRHTRITQMKEK